PKEIMLQWHSSGWLHRAYWGDNLIAWGADNTGERKKVGPLPPTGKWVRLEVPAEQVGLKAGAVINGLAFTLHGGSAHWDKAGIVTQMPQGTSAVATLPAWLRVQQAAGGAGLAKEIQHLIK